MRERRYNVIVGAKGSGKTTFLAEKIIKKYKGNVCVVKHPVNIADNALFFLPQKTMSNWRQGAQPSVPVHFKISLQQGEEYREFLRWVLAGNFKNGALIVDDATLFERDRLTPEMAQLAVMCRHYGIDLYLVYHGLTLFPIDQFIFVNYFIIFNTTDNFEYKKNKIGNFDQLSKAVIKARQNRASNDKKIMFTPVIIQNTI